VIARAPIALFAFASIGVGCEPMRARDTRPVIALHLVGGSDDGALIGGISETELRVELARVRFERENTLHAGPLPPDLKEAIIDRMIEHRMIALEAHRLGIRPSTTAIAREMALMKGSIGQAQLRRQLIQTYQTEQDLERVVAERLAAGKLLTKQAHAGVEVSEADLESEWQNLAQEEKQRKARVRANHIVVRTEEEGKKILSELKKGAKFDQLAKQASIGPEGQNGGDLGWFEPGVMPKIFDDVCFSLKPDQLSPLTPSEYGFHIFKVTGVEPATELTFDQVKERLRAKLLRSRLEQAEASYLEQLKRRYRAVRDDKRIAAIE
jgi:parvulin-like peptidyl-prolyl isomerase